MNVARYLIPVCSYHFVVALWRGKQAESTNIKPRKTTIAILAALAASLALAEDFKTINGKQYKDATINGVEPDGIVLKTKSGIIKVYFIELPKEVQDFFHYNATEGDEYSRKQKEAVEQTNKGLLPPRLGQRRWISGKIIGKSNNALLFECSGEGSGRSDAATGHVVLRDHPDFAALAKGDRVAVKGVEIPTIQWGGTPPDLHAYRVPMSEAQSAALTFSRKVGAPNQTPTPPTKSPHR
jgi:hypothetical protein